MTKYKEFLMAHGAILERNSAELARDENFDVEFIIPQVLRCGLAVNYLHVDNPVPDIAIYDRSGVCRSFSCSGYQTYENDYHHVTSVYDETDFG